jgi:hypothetical protein
MWLCGLEGEGIKAAERLDQDPAIQPPNHTKSYIMFSGLKEKFNKLSPTAKLLLVTFIMALLGGAGVMGYKWYQNRQDALTTSSATTDSDSRTDSDSEEAADKPLAANGAPAKRTAAKDGAPSRVPKPKSRSTAASQPAGDSTAVKPKKQK